MTSRAELDLLLVELKHLNETEKVYTNRLTLADPDETATLYQLLADNNKQKLFVSQAIASLSEQSSITKRSSGAESQVCSVASVWVLDPSGLLDAFCMRHQTLARVGSYASGCRAVRPSVTTFVCLSLPYWSSSKLLVRLFC